MVIRGKKPSSNISSVLCLLSSGRGVFVPVRRRGARGFVGSGCGSLSRLRGRRLGAESAGGGGQVCVGGWRKRLCNFASECLKEVVQAF